ncbi:Uncharacterised protein [Enterobacter cloacae]|nr:Uncharacterised protein [Enterobacter cloacae]
MPSSHKDSEQVLRTAITSFFSNTDKYVLFKFMKFSISNHIALTFLTE